MSRHTLPSKPSIEVVIGYDRALKNFFGSIYKVQDDPMADEVVLDGFPHKDGFIHQDDPPLKTEAEAKIKLASLMLWVTQYHLLGVAQETRLKNTLMEEYLGNIDPNYAREW